MSCSGGCGKCDTNFAQGDNDELDDARNVGRYFAADVPLNDFTNSGEPNAERGTRLAQTLSKRYSSAICRMRSIVLVIVG